jgi:hypothetical protein
MFLINRREHPARGDRQTWRLGVGLKTIHRTSNVTEYYKRPWTGMDYLE